MRKWLVRMFVFAMAVGVSYITVKLVTFVSLRSTVTEIEKIESVAPETLETPTGESEDSLETDGRLNFDEYRIHAWYSFDDNGKMPEVGMINLYGSNADDDGNELKETVYYAGIYTSLYNEQIDEGFAEGIETKVQGNKFSFKTKKLRGIEYRFEGKFFKNKKTGDNGEEVLRGILRKYVKGKKVATVSGNFMFSEPYCLY